MCNTRTSVTILRSIRHRIKIMDSRPKKLYEYSTSFNFFTLFLCLKKMRRYLTIKTDAKTTYIFTNKCFIKKSLKISIFLRNNPNKIININIIIDLYCFLFLTRSIKHMELVMKVKYNKMLFIKFCPINNHLKENCHVKYDIVLCGLFIQYI